MLRLRVSLKFSAILKPQNIMYAIKDIETLQLMHTKYEKNSLNESKLLNATKNGAKQELYCSEAVGTVRLVSCVRIDKQSI